MIKNFNNQGFQQPKNFKVSHEQAQIIALQGLAFVAQDEDQMNALTAQTGMTIDELKAGASAMDGLTLGGILDFILWEEERVITFAEGAEMDPAMVIAARRELPGYSEPM